MSTASKQPDKPTRLYFKSYIQMIHNAVGSNVFRNFYVETPGRGIFDALDDGYNSCAFFVSAILVIFKKLHGVHGTVARTVQDLEESGWHLVGTPQAGDILVWKAEQFDDGLKEHIGFSIGNGNGNAISTSSTKNVPVVHDQHFGQANREITKIYRMTNWEQP